MRREGTGGERKAPKRSKFFRVVNVWLVVTKDQPKRQRAGKTKPISGRRHGGVGEKKASRWSWWRVASGRRVPWQPAVGRTAGSGDPRRTSECGEGELAVMGKCQNKANLLVVSVVLIIGML